MSVIPLLPLARHSKDTGDTDTDTEVGDNHEGLSDRYHPTPSRSQSHSPAPDVEEAETLLPHHTHRGDGPDISQWGLACLLLQHSSSTFTSGAYDFAAFLFLTEVFRDTLVPASLVGLITKLAGLVFSGYMGGLVDRFPRLRLIRWVIAAEKGFKGVNYVLFLVLFGPLSSIAQNAFHGQAPASQVQIAATWGILICTIVCSACLGLANTTLEVAIERDWVMTIAQSDSSALTKLNTNIRRIDLLSKLIAPLVVSLLTATIGYPRTVMVLLAWVCVTCAAEYLWIQVVYRQFSVLAKSRTEVVREESRVGGWWERERADWREFIRLPVFASSVSIAAIYLTTLSYDGTFIAYVKIARGYNDAFIALMRGICVLTGLLGTFIMPRLENMIGLERAGLWSIVFEVTCLAPAVFAFFVGTGTYGMSGETWNQVLLFGGIALSRVGLWSFDLCQLKQLQQSLDDHPSRNRLTALQISLQNTFDLLKYALTLAAATPDQFKWTALVSWLAVIGGAASYAVYLRNVRGHLIHLDWVRKRW